MLRCNLAGLIPLMASERYREQTEGFFERFRPAFEAVMRTGSYYILRRLPSPVAKRLLAPGLTALLSRQRADGLWMRSERVTWDILSAILHAGMGEPAGMMKYPRMAALDGSTAFYALLIRKHVLRQQVEADRIAISGLIKEISAEQGDDGSWEGTVIGTAVRMEELMDLGTEPSDGALQHGIDFLFMNYHDNLQGMHTREPYGLTGHGMFTGESRHAEFLAAQKLRPEWLPRAACFRTLAIIQNAVCLTLLLRIGLEGDARVGLALDNLHQLITAYGGLCESNIKKPFL